MKKDDLLSRPLEHISLEDVKPIEMIDRMKLMAFQARNLARAAEIYEAMVKDKLCGIILCLAGSLISAGLKKVIVEMVDNNMVDAIVSTGANIVDQDFFEGLGYKHYSGCADVDDNLLRELHIYRIYDTYIDEDQLRICDDTMRRLFDSLPPRPYASWEVIRKMGEHLESSKCQAESIVLSCYRKNVPVFCPAFSDSSAGFGILHHQWKAAREGRGHVSIDNVKDFFDLIRVKALSGTTGLLVIGGGVPKNFAQDIVAAAEILEYEIEAHKYLVQITVADERDGGVSGSKLREANSWIQIDQGLDQMVFGEATVMFPLLAGYAYHKKAYKGRPEKNFILELEKPFVKINK